MDITDCEGLGGSNTVNATKLAEILTNLINRIADLESLKPTPIEPSEEELGMHATINELNIRLRCAAKAGLYPQLRMIRIPVTDELDHYEFVIDGWIVTKP